jgi:assimilatory nitrate reductase catalytic subunit
VLRRRRAVQPPAGARSELWIMRELAARLQSPSSFSDDPETVFEELRRASAGGPADYSGIGYAQLEQDEVPAYWPFPAGSAGTPRLFLKAFAHPGGLARFTAVSPAAPAEELNRPGKLTLVTGRLLEHYQSGAQTRRIPELAAAQPEARLQLHPATALQLGIADGDLAEASNGRGSVRLRAELSTAIRPDTVFLPFHFPGGQSANLLTARTTDPVSGMPEFKTTAVQVRVLEKAGAV